MARSDKLREKLRWPEPEEQRRIIPPKHRTNAVDEVSVFLGPADRMAGIGALSNYREEAGL
jgi:hypothetical protein